LLHGSSAGRVLGRVGETLLRSFTTWALLPGRILGCCSVRWLVRVARRCAFLPLLVAALFQLHAVLLSASELVSRSAAALVGYGLFIFSACRLPYRVPAAAIFFLRNLLNSGFVQLQSHVALLVCGRPWGRASLLRAARCLIWQCYSAGVWGCWQHLALVGHMSRSAVCASCVEARTPVLAWVLIPL